MKIMYIFFFDIVGEEEKNWNQYSDNLVIKVNKNDILKINVERLI